jgi:hypothetical protein
MNTEPLAVLAAANPVPELPAVAPVEALTCLTDGSLRSHLRRRGRTRALAMSTSALLALATAGAGLVLSSGSSGPGVDVAAAAYAATSPGSGVIEAEFVIRSFVPGTRNTPLRHREWLDAATDSRREQTVGADGRVESELALSPGWTEIWSSGPTTAGTIFRFRVKAHAKELLKPGGLAFYRRLYQGGALRVVGRETLDGRRLWRLEGAVGFTRRSRGDRLQPIFGEVILVDPTTYLPVLERQVDLIRPGHATLLETRLVQYRRLPQGRDNQALALLSAVHRGARTVSRHVLSRTRSEAFTVDETLEP